MSQELSSASAEFQKHTAILNLSDTTQPELYSKKIAGVPFLLRNILVLQKIGIKRLLIWPDEQMGDSLNVLFEQIKKDPRLEIDWNHNRELSCFTNETSFLVFNGSALIEECPTKTKVVLGNENSLSFLPESLKHLSQDKKVCVLEPAVSGQPYRLETEEDFQMAEERLLKSGGLNNDSFMDRLLTRFISRQLTAIFLKTPFTPNQITFFSLVVGLGAAFCFFNGSFEMGIVGSVLLLVSAWIDCTDGEVARLKFMVSEWGAKLDIVADNIVHCFVFFAIGMGLYFSTGESLFKYLGMLAAFGSLASFAFLGKTILVKKDVATKKPSLPSGKKDITDQLANRDFTYLLFVLALFGRLDVFIFITAIGSNVFAVYLAWQEFQARLV